MKTQKLLKCCAAASVILSLAGCAKEEKKVPVVGVAQLVDQTSLNIIREAMFDEFEKLGYKDGETITIDYQNAAGKADSLHSIMSKYQGEEADAVVAIATGTAQAAQSLTDEIPVIFSAVSDPVGAGLVEDLDNPPHNLTGTSNEMQVDQMADLIEQMSPDARIIGCLYTPGEVNGVATLNRFKKEAADRGYEIVEATGTDLTTLQQALSSLTDKCDVLFSPNDNIVASGMSALAEMAVQADIPYYVSADSMVMDGGLAAVGIDYEQLGRETARMTVKVLEGEEASSMPVKVFRDDLKTYVNKNTAGRLNRIMVPEGSLVVEFD